MKTQPRQKAEREHNKSEIATVAVRQRIELAWVPQCLATAPPRRANLLLGRVILATMLLGGMYAQGQSGIPGAINYQGKLADNLGNGLPSGNYQVQFKIWSSPTDDKAGSYIWGRSFPVHVATNGMFNILLDDNGSQVNFPSTPKTSSLFTAFEDASRYLGLSIAATPSGNVTITNEISPRQRLVSAPFAIHAFNANYAGLSTNANNAALAAYAGNAGNATNFSGMTTNELLWATKPNQTVTGTLTVSGNVTNSGSLNVKGSTTLNGSLTASAATVNGPLTVSGSSTLTGTLSVAGNVSMSQQITSDGLITANGGINSKGLQGSGAIGWAATNLIVIKRFTVPNITSSATTVKSFDTQFPTSGWTAVIAGFKCDGDVADANIRRPWGEMRMIPLSGKWNVNFFLYPEAGIENITVDVMFIRTELALDKR